MANREESPKATDLEKSHNFNLIPHFILLSVVFKNHIFNLRFIMQETHFIIFLNNYLEIDNCGWSS